MTRPKLRRLKDYTYDPQRNDYIRPGEHECGVGDEKTAVIMDILGWCGCGRPEDALQFIRDGLRLMTEKTPEGVDHSVWFKEWWPRCEAYFGGSGGLYFFAYWADKEGLTEHGGSVPGWLDATGEDLLADLDEALTEVENES